MDEKGFSISTVRRDVTLIRCINGLATDFDHGFIGKGVFDQKLSVEQAKIEAARFFATEDIVLPLQSHSDQVVEISRAEFPDSCQGDAMVFEYPRIRPAVACMRTADCVPLLVFSPSRVGLIHAGWRGLANGIIAKTLARFEQTDSPLQIVIGPCAGRERYQVGAEVVEAIGANAVVISHGASGLILDLAATAARIAAFSAARASILNCAVCTIGDQRFHSHRRDGEQAGRNISFIRL